MSEVGEIDVTRDRLKSATAGSAADALDRVRCEVGWLPGGDGVSIEVDDVTAPYQKGLKESRALVRPVEGYGVGDGLAEAPAGVVVGGGSRLGEQ